MTSTRRGVTARSRSYGRSSPCEFEDQLRAHPGHFHEIGQARQAESLGHALALQATSHVDDDRDLHPGSARECLDRADEAWPRPVRLESSAGQARPVGPDHVGALQGVPRPRAPQPGRRTGAGRRVLVRRHRDGRHPSGRGPAVGAPPPAPAAPGTRPRHPARQTRGRLGPEERVRDAGPYRDTPQKRQRPPPRAATAGRPRPLSGPITC